MIAASTLADAATRVDVERRRLDLDQLAEIGEHLVDREVGRGGNALHDSTVFAPATPATAECVNNVRTWTAD